MKCLFVTSRQPDYLAAVLWDGLREVLGEDNVLDALFCPWLHGNALEDHPEFRVLCGQEGKLWNGDTVDLAVICACFNRDKDWKWVRDFIDPAVKVAYVETWDAAHQIESPQIKVDAVFRREIHQAVQYPYDCHHLSFAMPSRAFVKPGGERPYDVFFSGNPRSNHPERPVRWQMLAPLFQTANMHHSVFSTGRMPSEMYWDFLRQSKLALCPPGADDCEALRLYEAVACGAVPIILCHPERRRDPWFPPEIAFDCGLDGLAPCIDTALASDLTARSDALLEYGLKHHTTRVRAEKLLEKTL